MTVTSVALIGLGEVGELLADTLSTRADITAWDILFAKEGSAPARAARSGKVRACASAADAVSGASVIISAVTASQTVAAAQVAAVAIAPHAYFFDLNSASPASKREAAAAVSKAGGRYVEGAVMAPISPKGMGTPILLGGPHATAFQSIAAELGFSDARHFDDVVGRAAAAKLCRSVIVKGMEALLTESLLAARHYGVDQDVVRSLSNLFPGPDWERLSRYMISRTIEHGQRRSEEMREAARTVGEAGVAPLMSEATAERQAWAAQTLRGIDEPELASLLDAMRAAMAETEKR